MENNIAFYMRLSVDEKEKLESESISNQRLLLKHYISLDKDLNAFNIKEYVDDGYSGTSLNRPALQRLFGDVKIGKVNCIIVKDISRFMRDYITLGDYLENIFPFLGIRFISVNDGYDSQKESDTGIDIGIQFKGLLSDFYAKETAEKVRNSLLALKQQGKCMQANPPYGYIRDPDERTKIMIDEKTGEYVKRMFGMILEGYSTIQIARTFNKESVITPSARKREITGQTYKERSIYTENHTKTIWMNSSVCRILKNEMYTGTFIFNTVRKTKLYGGLTTKIPREEWGRIYNHHPPLISYEEFNQVQSILASRAIKHVSSSKKKEKSALQEVLYCKDCGHSLVIMQRKEARNLACSTCMMKEIKTNFEKIEVIEKQVLQLLQEKIDVQERYVKGNIQEIHSYSLEIEKLEKEKIKSFEKYKANKTSREDFIKVKNKINDRILRLNQCIHDTDPENVDNEDISILTKELVKKYISKILVYHNGGFEVQYK